MELSELCEIKLTLFNNIYSLFEQYEKLHSIELELDDTIATDSSNLSFNIYPSILNTGKPFDWYSNAEFKLESKTGIAKNYFDFIHSFISENPSLKDESFKKSYYDNLLENPIIFYRNSRDRLLRSFIPKEFIEKTTIENCVSSTTLNKTIKI